MADRFFFGDYADNAQTLGCIIVSGIMGGLLAEPASSVIGQDFPDSPLGIWERLGLGIAAAGIGTLVVANTQRSDKLHLFFFALLCSISFPAIIEKARGDVLDRENNDQATQIAQVAQKDSPAEIEAAFGRLEDSGISANNLSPSTAIDLEASLLQGIENISDGETISRSDTIRLLETAKSASEKAGLKRVEEKAKTALGDIAAESDTSVEATRP